MTFMVCTENRSAFSPSIRQSLRYDMEVMVVAFTKGRRCLLSKRAHMHICSQSNCFSRLKMKLTIGQCYSTLGKMTLSQMNRLKVTDCHFLAVSEKGNLEAHIANTSTPDNLCQMLSSGRLPVDAGQILYKANSSGVFPPSNISPIWPSVRVKWSNEEYHFDYHRFEIGQRAGFYTMYDHYSCKWKPLSESLLHIKVASCI